MEALTMKDKKKVKMTIKIDKERKEKIQKYKKYGFKASDIISMSLIQLEDMKIFEKLIENKIMEEQTLANMIELKQSIEKLNNKLNKIKFQDNYNKLQEIIKDFTEEEIIPREEIVYYCNVKPKKLEKEYFENISEQTGIPVDILITEIVNIYTKSYLEDLNIIV